MEKIKPYQLLNVRLRKVQTGSELIYLNELAKYTKKLLGMELDLTDIHVDKRLMNQEIFSYVTANGLVFNKPANPDDLVVYAHELRYFFQQEIEELAYVKYDLEGGEVVYKFTEDISKNGILHRDNRSQGYVSLYAMLVVQAYKEGLQPPVLTIAHKDCNQDILEYLHIDILTKYGNKLFDGAVVVETLLNEFGNQREWEAFLLMHRQLGLMNAPYTINEKYSHLTRHFEVGDVVLLYRTDKEMESKVINRLESCHPAVIRQITPQGIQVEYYPIIQTKKTRELQLMSVDNEFLQGGRKSIYSEEDYNRFYSCRENYSLTEIGVNHCTYTESIFILELLEDDSTKQYFENADGACEEVVLDTIDTIYAVFKDQGVEFDEERFLAKHFEPRGVTPVYDYYEEQARIREERLANSGN